MNIIAESELALVVSKLLANSIENRTRIVLDRPLNIDDILSAISSLRNGEFRDIHVLTNVSDIFRFWEHERFEGNYTRSSRIEADGHLERAPVYMTRVVPESTTIVLDSQSIGQLLVKRDVTAEITELTEHDRDRIPERFPGLTRTVLDEKIRLLVYEITKFEIIHSDSFAVLTSSESN